MPIAILKFKLPEEQEEFDLAQKASIYHSMLWDIEQYARTLRKYDDREQINKEEVLEKLRELLSEFE